MFTGGASAWSRRRAGGWLGREPAPIPKTSRPPETISTVVAILASIAGGRNLLLVTKHGLAEVLRSDDAAFRTLHAYFIDRLVPVAEQLLDAAAAAGEI